MVAATAISQNANVARRVGAGMNATFPLNSGNTTRAVTTGCTVNTKTASVTVCDQKLQERFLYMLSKRRPKKTGLQRLLWRRNRALVTKRRF